MITVVCGAPSFGHRRLSDKTWRELEAAGWCVVWENGEGQCAAKTVHQPQDGLDEWQMITGTEEVHIEQYREDDESWIVVNESGC